MKIQLEGIQVIYVPCTGRLTRKIRLFSTLWKHTHRLYGVVINITWVRFAVILNILLPKAKIIMDYRTGSVSPIRWKMLLKNYQMCVEARLCKHITTISPDLKEHLRLPKRTWVLPLGGEVISNVNKRFDTLRLLYVGTHGHQRQLDKMIQGLAEFLHKHHDVPVSLDMCGKGDGMTMVRSEIERQGLQECVKVHGFVPNEDIVTYYDRCNVGICFAPMTEYYLPQPFTKLYEYGLSGMAVISVRLADSVRRLIPEIGVLCEDNADSFAEALETLWVRRSLYDSKRIRNYFLPYRWDNVCKQLDNIIESL